MANKARGEVDLVIAGRQYPVAMTLDFMAEACEILGVDTMPAFMDRFPEFRPHEMRPLLTALLKGNGHSVSPEAIGSVSAWEYLELVRGLIGVRPERSADEGDANPPSAATTT